MRGTRLLVALGLVGPVACQGLSDPATPDMPGAPSGPTGDPGTAAAPGAPAAMPPVMPPPTAPGTPPGAPPPGGPSSPITAFGANPHAGGTTFRVWALHAARVFVTGDWNGGRQDADE